MEDTRAGDECPILVAVVDTTIYVRPVGAGTMANSLGLPDFLRGMLRQGCTDVVFDFRECRDIDSTFLGVIATVAIPHGQLGRKSVVVLNASDRVLHELRMVGLMKAIVSMKEPVELPEEVELKEVDFVHLPGDERRRVLMIKDLHEELVNLNARNRELYAGFIRMLDEELRQENSQEG